jgi:DNA-directed RNA polymerase subunit alpha
MSLDFTIALPSKPRVAREEGTKGTYEIDGLYPGYGHTLGNSLRRVILSSLPGAAATRLKIAGVPHEFSTLDGVKEDVVAIILNVQKLRVSLATDEAQTLRLKAKGQKTLTAADLEIPGQVEIKNPELILATLTEKDASIDMEITVEKGLGFVPKEDVHKERVEVGEIAIDAIFTPIRRVSYEAENMRVGDRTDFNRLRVSIETDGTISPRQALENAIEIMIQQLKAVVGFREESVEPAIRAEAGAPAAEDGEALKARVEDLGLSGRIEHALAEAGIRTVGGLARKREADLLELDGMGPKAVNEIKEALAARGVSLKG